MGGAVGTEATEALLLGFIQDNANRMLAFARSCPVGGTPAAMSAFLDKIDQDYIWSFQEWAPLAESLRSRGAPAAAERLTAILHDYAVAREQWTAMYQGMLGLGGVFGKIWAEAARDASRNILAATDYSNAVFASWQQSRFDMEESLCFFCQNPLKAHVPGGGYHYDCAKRLGLVR